ncbi:NAD-dependent epimerase/dehydratase family protein [Clostridium bornimense]|uniref:NAD-dependent epimerase/dehydratase family protein n=1 Tax=Clostridium bornimense TaxID=1216932 RepID=UPI001C0FF630|nr:NAD-dependent epimerase/dehydratase family protein [Clostridium bornimense]MBU5316054.1 NAD-dependent epimerase/dehydratase family protein [Clostridium bornimense]
MNTILVLGGSTFVSKAIAKYLISKNYTVDILTRGIIPIEYTGFREHIICDRHDLVKLKKSLENKNYDYIIDISAYEKRDIDFLLDSINKSTVKKYVFCSSGAVYPSTDEIISEAYKTGYNENWGSYGTNKKEAEDSLIASNLKYCIFRPTYIYGEDNNLYRERFFMDKILNNETIPIPPKNSSIQFISIDDVVKTFESAILNEDIVGIFNLTHPSIYTFEEIAFTIAKALEKDYKIKRVTENIPARSYFPFRDVTYLLNTDKLKNSNLHYPTIDLEEGIRKLL